MSAQDRTYGDRYAVIELVGSGGMAEVYRARDELLGREVALKVLSHRLSTDRSFVERFRREAQAAANLNHPNIVSLYDYGSDNGTYFIVMEYIDGRPLNDIIGESGPLLPERSVEIASDVARALHRAHESGLVHRDIKPANIMVTSTAQTKVTDFGIARALVADGEQTVTQTGMVIGTASYLSPEQAQGNPVDARSDVYSLGCVLYEMLAGRAPFAGESPLSIAYKHVREDPEPPSTVNSDVPQALDAIVLKAMSKNPDNRYASATEMDEDLQRFLSGQRVLATPILADETMVAPPVGGRTEVLRADEYEPEPDRRRAGLYVAMTLVILGVVALLAYLLATNLLGGDPVTVPDVVGMDVNEATQELSRVRLEWEIEDRFSRRPVGEVVEQDPEADAEAEEGDVVTLFVSSGVRQVEVPDLEGLTQEEAEERLEDARLRRGDVSREPSDEIEEDRVTRSDPAAGEEVDRGTEVDLFISSGPEPVIVPSVVGDPESEARAELEAADFEVEVNRAPSDEEEGIVIAQDPEGGSEAQEGDTVVITVSQGPEEREMPDVRGDNADDAEEFLEESFGLNVSQEDATGPCAQPPGTVCEQSPEPGTPVSAGDDATLFVQPGTSALGDDRAFAFLAGFFSLFF
ncbi:MAG: Stk1 family PASTA domain-containing Ser/Thr kinase [Actinomycetota bacterium]